MTNETINQKDELDSEQITDEKIEQAVQYFKSQGFFISAKKLIPRGRIIQTQNPEFNPPEVRVPLFKEQWIILVKAGNGFDKEFLFPISEKELLKRYNEAKNNE